MTKPVNENTVEPEESCDDCGAKGPITILWFSVDDRHNPTYKHNHCKPCYQKWFEPEKDASEQ